MNRWFNTVMCGAMILGFATLRADALEILAPGDFVLAIDVDEATGSRFPPSGAENPPFVADGLATTKYLNFGDMPAGGQQLRGNTGFIVTPSVPTIVQSFVLTTANDSPERSPATWVLWGTNEQIVSVDNGSGSAEHWTRIADGAVALPDTFLTAGPVVSFENSTSYSSYRMTFPTLKNSVTANSMQLGDAAFYESSDGMGTNVLLGNLGVIGYKESQSRYPTGENPSNILDGDSGTKYLNFAEENSGFIVTPASGASTISSFTITTANDTPARDPASWILYGTNSEIQSIDNSTGNIDLWTQIDTGTLSLPNDRFATSSQIPINNSTEYTSYRMVFPTVKDAAGTNSMQIADVQFFSVDEIRIEVDRDTGEIRIVSDSNVSIGSYEIRSDTYGALDDSAWTPIADGGFDPDDAWTVTSMPGDPTLLAEEMAAGGAGDGATIASGSPLSLGAAWLRTPFEDIAIDIFDVNGVKLSNTVNFTGSAVVLGDYTGDGFVTIDDWSTFKAGLGGQYDDLSIAQAYLNGDLDGDFDSDLDDFNLFVNAAGGMGALFGTTVPEPSSIALLVGGGLGLIGYKRLRCLRVFGLAVLGFMMTSVLVANQAEAQTFSTSGIVPTVTTPDQNENEDSGPINMFDDSFLDGQINTDLFNLDYNMFTEPPLPLQYAGMGADPKRVFFDFGTTINANWFAYAQRSGADPTADRVGKFEFWFSNADFMDMLPATEPDAVLEIKPDDPRLQDSVIRPYTLSGERSFQYAAMRITVSELSADQPTNNIGGHEFRFLEGPSDIVLEIDRANGNMTMRNNGPMADAIDFKAYEIRSDGGGLDPSGFNGIGGDDAAFTLGTGTGNGWELGGGLDTNRLVEAFFSGTSTFPIAGTVLQLGSAYNELAASEDVMFRYTNSLGHVFDGRVEYVGESPVIPGDHNGDGAVNAADYVLGRDQIPGFHPAFFNNFGAGSGSGIGAASVPEPSSLAILGIGFAVVGAIGARRRFI